jgi:hypothetical protein
MARIPVLPEATFVGALSAQLRHPRSGSATSAIRRLRLVAAGDTASDFSKGAPGVYRQDFEDMDHCQTIRSSVRALRNSIRTLGNHAQLGNGAANDGDKDSQRA